MSSSHRTWQLTRSAPVRADAEGLFVRVSDLPDAALGDHVVVSGPDGSDSRTSVIAAVSEGQHHDSSQPDIYFRLELDV